MIGRPIVTLGLVLIYKFPSSSIKCAENLGFQEFRCKPVMNKLVKLLDVTKVGPEATKILVSGNRTFDRTFESA